MVCCDDSANEINVLFTPQKLRIEECKINSTFNANINGIPSSEYLSYTRIKICDSPTKALNRIRTSTIINKGTNKLNNQKYFQSHKSYLAQKNKTYNRNLAVSNDNNPASQRGLYSTPYNAITSNNETCCNNVVKTYNNHNSSKTQMTRKMWGSMDSSSRIQERKMSANKNALF